MSDIMTESEIATIFNKVFNGAHNFMTPDITGYMVAGPYLVECGKGSGFTPGTMLYGVTVLKRSDTGEFEPDHERSMAFHSRAEASRHIQGLTKEDQ